MCELPSPVVAGCTFCSIVEGSSPSQTIYEDDNAQAFMDLLPMTPGHCLIVPKKHVVDVWDLDDDECVGAAEGCLRWVLWLRPAHPRPRSLLYLRCDINCI